MFPRTLAAAFCALFLMCALTANAVAGTQNVTVIWDANGEPDIAGYRLFYGTQSRAYTNQIDVPGTDRGRKRPFGGRDILLRSDRLQYRRHRK